MKEHRHRTTLYRDDFQDCMTQHNNYRWVSQDCPICEIPPTKYLGRRGGAAHRQNLGVECRIWRCGTCGLIFPNPMPLPLHGPEQHYAVSPEDYFHHHEESDKLQYGAMLMHQLQELRINKGMLLDIGAGRGETLRVAREAGWKAVGIETSPSFAEHAARYSGAEIIQKPLQECGFGQDTFDAVSSVQSWNISTTQRKSFRK